MKEVDNYEQLYKIIIIGDSGVGKSNILGRYLHNEFHEDTKSTVGVEFGSKKMVIENTSIKLQIWDTAGEERYRSITSAYYKGSKGCFIVYDITNPQSFEDIQKWYEEIKRSGDKGVSIILVGNKCDLEHQRAVTKNEGNEMALKYGIKYLETSAKDTINIENLFFDTAKNLLAKQQSSKVGVGNSGPNSYGIDLTNTGNYNNEDNKRTNQNSNCC